MRVLFIAFIFAVELFNTAFAQSQIVVDPLSLGDLDSYFESIHYQDSSVAFKRNLKSRSLICQIGSEDVFVSEPGSVFEIKTGSYFRLFDKHSEIKFLSFGIDKGIRGTFLVEEATIRNSEAGQTIHAGLLRVISCSTQVPRPKSQLEVDPLINMDLKRLVEMEKECRNFTFPPATQTPVSKP